MLKIHQVTKRYEQNRKVLDQVSLTVNSGDLYGFIGANGAGKTTMIKAVVGIHSFDEGDITIDGFSINDNPVECKQRIAYIPDKPDLYEHLTGIQYINFIANMYRLSKEERINEIEKYAAKFEMTQHLGKLIASYSHGMKQRLAIISALIHHPKLLILDEPFVGLDPRATIELRNAMKEVCENGGAIFFSTHVLDVAQKLCNKVAIIHHGQLLMSGETKELIQGGSLEELFMEVAGRE